MDTQRNFQPYFENFGQGGGPHASGVNQSEAGSLEKLLGAPLEAPGRGILLRSPRAGYGKTHLLDQVRQRLASGYEFIPLRPLDGRQVDPRAAIEDALRRMTRQLPAGAGLTALDVYTRKLLALALQPLVLSGEVPCQDRESAVSALRQRPVETFDFHHPQAVTAHWTRENFEVLGPRLSLEVSRTTGCSLNQVAFWLASLFRFAVGSPEHPGRAGMILQSATSEPDAERFGTLLALLSRSQRMIVIVDDLEGVHGDPEGARRVAGFLATVRQEAPRVDIVVSVNDDVWDSGFVPALSGGLLDRLSEQTVRLDSMSDAAIISLLEARGYADTASLLSRLGLRPEERYARRVLRAADEIAGAPGSTAPERAESPEGRKEREEGPFSKDLDFGSFRRTEELQGPADRPASSSPSREGQMA